MKTWDYGGAFIARLCGNYTQAKTTPVPKISGYKFEDLNGDGAWQQGTEPPVEGWEMTLYDPDGNAYPAIATTNILGYYEFEITTRPGTYEVVEESRPGWAPTTAQTLQVNIPEGAGDTNFTGNNFGNQRVATFEVLKDFVPNNAASVTVTLTCDTGVVTPASASASEASPAVFTVTGFTPDPNCTATESPIPIGYLSSGECSAALAALSQCTITNRLRSATVNILKDFSDNNVADVTVGLICTSGSVANDDVTASEADDANFTVTGFNAGATCTATEGVPSGYSADQSNCLSVALVDAGTANCTIVNTLNTDNFTVNKDFSDNNAASVTVTLTCDTGVVTPASASASEVVPAVFTVTGFTPDPNCTATESPIPTGYTSTGTCSAALVAGGQCTITNTLNSGTFTVNKDFSDNNAASVTVTLTCDTGVVTPASASASEVVPAVFTVTGFTPDPNCTATESPIPTGYTSTGTCSAALVAGGQCTITNTLNSGTFTVNKDFSDNNAASVTVTLTCDTGVVTPASASASEVVPAVFTVTGFSGSANCTASESPVPTGYTASGCTTPVNLPANGTANCTIVNTAVPPTTATISVLKDFSDNDTGSVTVSVTCTSGTVTNVDTSASEADDANFTVTSFTDPGTTCTATEGAAPIGYSKDESNCVNVAISEGDTTSCTITNTLVQPPPPEPPPVGGIVELLMPPNEPFQSGGGGSNSWDPWMTLAVVSAVLGLFCGVGVWHVRKGRAR